MESLYKKKLNKIYKRLDSLSSKGKDNILEYYKYINELIDKGDYSVFEEVINLYYKIDINDYYYIKEYRDKVWEEICLQTKLPILVRINKLYKDKGLYQQSNYIFKQENYEVNDNGEVIPIGQIIELEKTTDNYDYLIKNKMYARLIGERTTLLEVINKSGLSFIVDDYDFNLTPDQNQFNQYKIAIDYLLNQ
jgi:hypothetical protein